MITHDLDFGELLAFSRDNKPSVILFRIHYINVLLFYTLIKQNWSTINEPLENGALVVIEENNIRIRKLPITK
jgi:predicted nuclease of predicted toxin-antitoxin system